MKKLTLKEITDRLDMLWKAGFVVEHITSDVDIWEATEGEHNRVIATARKGMDGQEAFAFDLGAVSRKDYDELLNVHKLKWDTLRKVRLWRRWEQFTAPLKPVNVIRNAKKIPDGKTKP